MQKLLREYFVQACSDLPETCCGSDRYVSASEILERIRVSQRVILSVFATSILELSDICSGRMICIEKDKLRVALENGKGERSMKIKGSGEQPSTLEDLNLPLQLVAGEIQLSVRDILDLELGKECEINLPEDRKIELYLGGECIADAFMSMKENQLFLKIISVHLQLDDEKNDNDMSAVTQCHSVE